MAPRKNYTPEQMGKAVEAVRNGLKVAVAAKSFGVPRITLYNKVTGKTPINCTMGPDTVLSKEQEDILSRWVLALSEKHFPITKLCLQDSVQKLIIDLKLPNPFNNNRPGKKWCKSFLKRHPELVEKIPENLSKARDNVSEKDINNWFQEVDTYLKESNLEEVVKDPNRVFNTDESAFFLSPKPGRVLAKKGEKHLYAACGDEKDNLTVLFTGNASGLLAPPMIVFNYERIPSHIAASVPENWAIGKSESGWMCSSTFYEYVTNIFNPWLDETKIEKPILFFLDGHKSHLTLHLSNFCAQNGIEIIALYPNSTHILQPMDLAVFRPLKVFWKQSVNEWKLQNLGQSIKKETFAPVLQKAVARLTDECVKNGFRAGGLCPFGPQYIDMTKLKHRDEKEPFKPNTELTAFVKYLESEIVKVFSAEKLNLFNQLFYKNRNTVDQCLPDEDIALYVIWAKNKSECGFNNPLIESAVVNNRSNSEPSAPTTPAPIRCSSVIRNDELFHSPIQNEDMESQSAPIPAKGHTDHESLNIFPVSPQKSPTSTFTSISETKEQDDGDNVPISRTIHESVLGSEIPEIVPVDGIIALTEPNVDFTNALPVQTIYPEPTRKSQNTAHNHQNEPHSVSLPSAVTEEVSLHAIPGPSYCHIDTSTPQKVYSKSTCPLKLQTIVHDDKALKNVFESVSTPPVHTEVSLEESIAIVGPSKLVTPQKQSIDAALGIIVPSPFKRNLFWPGTDNTKKSKRIKKEKIPSAVTSKAWREYHEKKETEKKKQEEEKAERAKNRQEKKILKEKTAEEKRIKCFSKSVTKKLTPEERNTKHSNSKDKENQETLKQNIAKKEKSKPDLKLKRKKVVIEDSTSEDSDLDINFAESGDSYVEEIDEYDYLSEEEKIDLSINKENKLQGNTKWQERHLKRKRTPIDTSDSELDVTLSKLPTSNTVTKPKKKICSGCYVIVMYEGEYFPGRIDNADNNQYEVSTMTLSTGNSFRWPDKPDRIWYKEDQIIEKIDEPVCFNKRGFYKVREMEKYLPDILYT